MLTIKDGINFGFGMLLARWAWRFMAKLGSRLRSRRIKLH